MTRDTGRWRSRVLSQCCRLLTDFHPRRSRTRDGMSSVQCPDPRHTEHRRAWCNHRPSSIYTLDHQLTADYSGQEIYSVERVRGAAQHPPVTCHVSSCHVNLAAISKQTFLRNNPAILSHNGQHGPGRREQSQCRHRVTQLIQMWTVASKLPHFSFQSSMNTDDNDHILQNGWGKYKICTHFRLTFVFCIKIFEYCLQCLCIYLKCFWYLVKETHSSSTLLIYLSIVYSRGYKTSTSEMFFRCTVKVLQKFNIQLSNCCGEVGNVFLID